MAWFRTNCQSKPARKARRMNYCSVRSPDKEGDVIVPSVLLQRDWSSGYCRRPTVVVSTPEALRAADVQQVAYWRC